VLDVDPKHLDFFSRTIRQVIGCSSAQSMSRAYSWRAGEPRPRVDALQ
jgi:hypothetical protein